MEQQLAAVTALRETVAYHGWEFQLGDLELLVFINPKAQPEVRFLAQLSYEDYPQKAPSLAFVNPDTKEPGREFWPQKGKAFAAAVSRNPPQLCIEGVREYHEQLHSGAQFIPEVHTLAKLLDSMQAELDAGYQAQ